MKILLDEEKKLYLVSDDTQFAISQENIRVSKKTNEEETYQKHLTYHSTIPSALRSYLQLKLKKSKVTTIEGLIKKIEELNKECEGWLKHFDIKVGG